MQLDGHPINYILISLDLKTIVHAHALCIDMIPSDPEVSKCNQSRWPSNCTGFHGHHVMKNSSIVLLHFTSCPTSDDVTTTLMGVRDRLTHHRYHRLIRRHWTHSSSCTCSAIVFETWLCSLLTVPTFSWRWMLASNWPKMIFQATENLLIKAAEQFEQVVSIKRRCPRFPAGQLVK